MPDHKLIDHCVTIVHQQLLIAAVPVIGLWRRSDSDAEHGNDYEKRGVIMVAAAPEILKRNQKASPTTKQTDTGRLSC